ncbi:uncharacterized protein LACBIDRAFT_307926 [Laccaria bicolor S238N-H82]|uniref:Predicted protein n=1 Tax=Laccaria bicolor (strain S238N-H82 / ATCC MYA-4686) TaxID=486041 RepID=B0DR82_LACBS|nr:uncharacterized protein LACBIDRAFT_307926 [Laccaria bicolor S238N-H82]EDR02827.1 predicted protein [Laccaria bicolor S238N-H82]|eukprot:XP_001886537.1 predicted protein [Laccaria bicolor S238N-H82]
MDFLPLDDTGLVPQVDFRTIGEDLWVGLNASCDKIPSEASAYVDYQSNQRVADEFRDKGPTGLNLEMEWALDADWYDPEASWRPFLPLPSGMATEWYYQMDQGTPSDPESISPQYTIFPPLLSEMEKDLHRFESYVVAIAKSSIFPARAARPGLYDFEQLKGPFDSIRSLENFGANVKRQALDYLSFLAWWTLSASGWDVYLPQDTVDSIMDLGLDDRPKRGVLLDLDRDWKQMSIPHLLRHRVPVFYRWNESLQSNNRFLSLSPYILRAFDKRRKATPSERVFAIDLPEFTNDFEVMKDYDEFFQRRVFHNEPSPDLEFRADWHYAVVDFQGWMYRPIDLETAKELARRFGSHVVRRENRTSVIFRRWEAFQFDDTIAEPAGLAEAYVDRDPMRGNIEIREIHKSFFAPVQNQKFDLNGFPDYGPLPGNNLLRPTRPRSWVEAMSSAGHTSSRSSSSGPSRRQSSSKNLNRSSPYPRPRSSSPSFRATYQHRDESSPETTKEQFIRRLRVQGNIVGTASLWLSPVEAEWNPLFLEEGVLLFPDNRTQIRVRYWTICGSPSIRMRQVLDFAISRGMKFLIAIPFDALPHFHQLEKQNMASLTKRTYDTGFQESPLTYSKGGSAFMDQYLGKLADILRRPHARAVIAMGGPTSWIARFYGGSRLVEEYMSGPSSQVTVHHRGGVTVAPFLDMPVFHDQLSKQEIELIHGYIPLGNPNEDRWAFPTSELLEEFSNHWRGEWNQGCERIMGNIARALESGALAPLTRREWREYLRNNNRGEHAPSPGSIPKDSDFAFVENAIDSSYPVRWHGRRIRDIFLPEDFEVSSSGN